MRGHALAEQHAWKLVAALFLPQPAEPSVRRRPPRQRPTRPRCPRHARATPAARGSRTSTSCVRAQVDSAAGPFASDDGAAAAATIERRREAVSAWLRLALGDGVAAEGGGAAVASERLGALIAALHTDEAVDAALADSGARTHPAAMLAQPPPTVAVATAAAAVAKASTLATRPATRRRCKTRLDRRSVVCCPCRVAWVREV